MLRIEESATRLTIFVGADDRWHDKPLFTEIVHRAHEAGLASASVWHGLEGYGSSARIHTDRILDLADNLPVLIVIIDSDHAIRDFLPQLDELISEGLAITDPVVVVRFASEEAK